MWALVEHGTVLEVVAVEQRLLSKLGPSSAAEDAGTGGKKLDVTDEHTVRVQLQHTDPPPAFCPGYDYWGRV